MMSPRVTAMSATSLSPKWSRLRSICRSIGDRSPTFGASPSWLSITSSIWLRRVASLSSPNRRVRRPRQKLRPLPSSPVMISSAIRLGSNLAEIGAGYPDRAKCVASEPLPRRRIRFARLTVVAEPMARSVADGMGGMVFDRHAFVPRLGRADAVGEHEVAEKDLAAVGLGERPEQIGIAPREGEEVG